MTLQEQLLGEGNDKISVDNDHNLQRFLTEVVHDTDYNEKLTNNLKRDFHSYIRRLQREQNIIFEQESEQSRKSQFSRRTRQSQKTYR